MNASWSTYLNKTQYLFFVSDLLTALKGGIYLVHIKHKGTGQPLYRNVPETSAVYQSSELVNFHQDFSFFLPPDNGVHTFEVEFHGLVVAIGGAKLVCRKADPGRGTNDWSIAHSNLQLRYIMLAYIVFWHLIAYTVEEKYVVCTCLSVQHIDGVVLPWHNFHCNDFVMLSQIQLEPGSKYKMPYIG